VKRYYRYWISTILFFSVYCAAGTACYGHIACEASKVGFDLVQLGLSHLMWALVIWFFNVDYEVNSSVSQCYIHGSWTFWHKTLEVHENSTHYKFVWRALHVQSMFKLDIHWSHIEVNVYDVNKFVIIFLLLCLAVIKHRK